MACKRIPRIYFENAWDPDFSQPRDPPGGGRPETFFEGIDDIFGHHLGDDEESVRVPCKVEEVKSYCGGTCFDRLTSETPSQDRRNIWIDDRTNTELTGSGHARQCGNALSATAL